MRLAEQTFDPLGTVVILQMFKVTESSGGVQLPDSVADLGGDQTPRGLVVSAGPDCKMVKRGDEVLVLAKMSCWKVKHGGQQELIALNEDKILGVVRRAEG